MSDESHPSMDYAEHERTYEGFINFSKVGIVAAINVLLCLIVYAFGGAAAGFFGTVLLVATLFACAIGLFMGAKGWIPSALVMGLGVVIWILTVA